MIDSPTNGATDFIIALRSNPAHAIGMVGINMPDSDELGFIISRSHWGTGIAQEAVACILNHLFTGSRGMGEVIAEVDPRNERCLRFLKKFGFAESGFTEKMWEVGSEWWSSVRLRLAREEWEARQTPVEDI